MKKPIKTFLAILFATMLLFGGNSCTKNEIYSEDASGILSCRFQLPDGRVFDCVVDQINETIANSKDSLLFGTGAQTLQKIRPVFTTTIGAKVFVNGVEVKSGETEIDLTKPLKIETKYNNASRDYNVNVLVEKADHSATSGAKVNTDMTLTGLPAFNSYSAAWFNGKLYILGAYYPNATSASGTAYYELYTSPDGGKWTKVETNPKVVGGFGAELIVLGNKMFAAGGSRLWGKDVEGTDPERSISWKMMSTTNGTDWADCTPGQVNAPSGRIFPQMTVHNGKIVLRRGKFFGFGMWQNQSHSDTYQSVDGTNWTRVSATPTTATNRSEDAMFSFGGKLWITGGYAGYINNTNVREDLWSSQDNGATWVQESVANSAELRRIGHKVVSHGGKLYMIGGEKVVGSARDGIRTVLHSVDGANWTPLSDQLQLPVAFTTRIYSNIFMGEGNLAWIIGGFDKSMGNYAISGLGMPIKYDVWTKRIN